MFSVSILTSSSSSSSVLFFVASTNALPAVEGKKTLHINLHKKVV
jgi:hypothetical protein